MNSDVNQQIDAFFSQFRPQKYPAGQILIQADEEPSGIFYLKKGAVKKYFISERGEAVVLNMFKPISFFPMNWAINHSPNEYFFEAQTDCEVIKAPADETVQFVKSHPDVLFDLMRRVFKGTDGLESRLRYLMSGSAYERLVAEIIIQASRFGEKRADGISLHVTEPDLAASTGLTRETVSRELKILKEKKLVTFQKATLIIPSLELLKQENI